MKSELVYLTLTALLTGSLWVPVVVGYVRTRGALRPEDLRWRDGASACVVIAAHGYPGEQNARWYWAVVVDAMAFVLCFWGVTGLVIILMLLVYGRGERVVS